ncbi:hypothetical protein NS07_v2contig00059-0024 [Nocardia seriolae]|nr:hypothetical protein NS07_v2contig00059-0024 [Nocardia seriolae]
MVAGVLAQGPRRDIGGCAARPGGRTDAQRSNVRTAVGSGTFGPVRTVGSMLPWSRRGFTEKGLLRDALV